MFYQFDLDLTPNVFDELSNFIKFESIAKGRKVANCFLPTNKNIIPIIRTTTIYSNPIQKFSNPYKIIINQIKSQALKLYNINVGELNNGLVETYTCEYKTMGFHSDQALDLDHGSWICIFSTYSNPELVSSTRKLIVQSKLTNQQTEYNLTNNSVIMFDTKTNSTYVHKIVLSNNEHNLNKWIGITLRTSRTHIEFIDYKPYMFDDMNNMNELVLATLEEKKEFYFLKSQENKLINFTYPYINYTISPSDLINPYDIIN